MIQKVSLGPNILTSVNASTLAKAFILQKGALEGRGDFVRIVPALSNWTGGDLSCNSDLSRFILHPRCGVNATSNVNYYTTIEHAPMGWAAADVTKQVHCLLHDFARASLDPQANVDLSFLWEPIAAGECHPATPSTFGKTEWYTADSLDPPILMLFYHPASS